MLYSMKTIISFKINLCLPHLQHYSQCHYLPLFSFSPLHLSQLLCLHDHHVVAPSPHDNSIPLAALSHMSSAFPCSFAPQVPGAPIVSSSSTNLPGAIHSIQTRSKNHIHKPREFTDVTISYLPSKALVTVKATHIEKPTSFTTANQSLH